MSNSRSPIRRGPPDPVHPSGVLADAVAGRLLPEGWGRDAQVGRRLLGVGLAGLAVSDALARGREPDTISPSLAAAHRRGALRAALTIESAHRAREAMAVAGIPSLAFKGVALLASGIYCEPGARPMEDADLLIPAESADDAVGVLRRAGFEPWQPWTFDRTRWVSSVALSDREAPDGLPVHLDLHWATPYTSLRTAPPWAPDALWRHADLETGVPAPETHYVVIAEHVLKHLRVVAHLRGLADLVRLAPRLRRAHLVRASAEERRSLPGVRLLTAFLTEDLGAAVPGPVLHALDLPGPLSERGRRILRHMLADDGDEPRLVGGAGGVLQTLTLLTSPPHAVQEVARVLAPPASWLRARYGPRARLRRLRYVAQLAAWGVGLGYSPLSPNQEAG